MCLCTQNGILTADSRQRVRDELLSRQRAGALGPILNALGVSVDQLVDLLLPQIQGPIAQSGTCGTTIPANGYPRCPATGGGNGQCTFACNDGYKVCGTGCVLNNVVCPSTAASIEQRAVNVCPAGWTSCPVTAGKTVVYECVATDKDLESCGGCSGLQNDGVDCSSLPGVNDVAVSALQHWFQKFSVDSYLDASFSSALLASVKSSLAFEDSSLPPEPVSEVLPTSPSAPYSPRLFCFAVDEQ